MASRSETVPAEMVVIGVFPDPDAATQAIRELKDAGFTEEEIGVIVPKRGPGGDPLLVQGEDLDVEAEAVKTTAATGGIVGGLIGLLGSLLIPGLGPVTLGGVLASTLIGAGAGAVTGGLIGLLVGMGLSRAQAEYFDGAVRAGGTLVTVQPVPAREPEARAILMGAGADFGPSAQQAGAPVSDARDREAEAWRGNERRYRQDESFAGPERRKAHA
jgi:predicted lipid-binding transport protein (Tim44 family)